MVLAFPKASRIGFACSSCFSSSPCSKNEVKQLKTSLLLNRTGHDVRLTKLSCYIDTEVKTSLYEILYSRRPKIPPAAAARETRRLEIIKYLHFPQNWPETQQRSSRGQRSSTDKSWLNKPKMVHDWIKCSRAKSRCNVQVSYGGSWESWRPFFDFSFKSSKIKN